MDALDRMDRGNKIKEALANIPGNSLDFLTSDIPILADLQRKVKEHAPKVAEYWGSRGYPNWGATAATITDFVGDMIPAQKWEMLLSMLPAGTIGKVTKVGKKATKGLKKASTREDLANMYRKHAGLEQKVEEVIPETEAIRIWKDTGKPVVNHYRDEIDEALDLITPVNIGGDNGFIRGRELLEEAAEKLRARNAKKKKGGFSEKFDEEEMDKLEWMTKNADEGADDWAEGQLASPFRKRQDWKDAAHAEDLSSRLAEVDDVNRMYRVRDFGVDVKAGEELLKNKKIPLNEENLGKLYTEFRKGSKYDEAAVEMLKDRIVKFVKTIKEKKPDVSHEHMTMLLKKQGIPINNRVKEYLDKVIGPRKPYVKKEVVKKTTKKKSIKKAADKKKRKWTDADTISYIKYMASRGEIPKDKVKQLYERIADKEKVSIQEFYNNMIGVGKNQK